MDEMIVKRETVFKIHSLSIEVFSIESINIAYTAYPTLFYYWKNLTSPQLYGPFPSVNDTVKNYENLMKAVKTSKANPTEGTVIRADFHSKRRLDP